MMAKKARPASRMQSIYWPVYLDGVRVDIKRLVAASNEREREKRRRGAGRSPLRSMNNFIIDAIRNKVGREKAAERERSLAKKS